MKAEILLATQRAMKEYYSDPQLMNDITVEQHIADCISGLVEKLGYASTVPLDEIVNPVEAIVTKSEHTEGSLANGAVADKYNFALLILEGMRLVFFEHKDEMEIAQDTLLKNGKRLQYYKKDKNGYWIKPDVYE